MSYRELWVLINRLPQESWTQTELRDTAPDSDLVAPETSDRGFGPWALEHYLLANLIDAINRGNWLYVMAHTPEGKQPPAAPEPTPRPGAKPAKVREISPEASAYLNRLRAPKGE